MLKELKEENKSLKEDLDKKPIPDAKMSKQTDTIPQTYHSRMSESLKLKRKALGL